MKTLLICLFSMLLFSMIACDDDNSSNNANNTNNTNNANNATCGNSVVETGEACDGTALNGATCVTAGFTGGTLACTTTCTFNTTGCTNNAPVCGNGVVETGEACDGTAFNNKTCVTEGFTGGTLACTASCTLNTAGCTNGGGDGVIGDACSGTPDCGGVTGAGLTAECLTSLGGFITMPGGYCTSTCTAPANPGDPDACTAVGGVCMNAMMASYCVKPCEDASDCREGEGYTCAANPMGGEDTYCLPPMGM
jgi:hypothetical protein